MKISDIINAIEHLTPPALQENYDNSGLLAGDKNIECTGVICSLDLTEQVIYESIVAGANLIVTHHPILFKPLKTLQPRTYAERCLLLAIKNDIAIYAVHTNYDNVLPGVNLALSEKIGLDAGSLKILAPVSGKIAKLYTYVPVTHAEELKDALFASGAGQIGRYRECSFTTHGKGTFRPMAGTNPFLGKAGGEREVAEEAKIEVIFPTWLKNNVLQALRENHPYEEIAYEILVTENELQDAGAGMTGVLPDEMDEQAFLTHIKKALGLSIVRHSPLTGKKIKKVAVCGGAGSFLTKKALGAGAAAFLTADLKYHDFFDADGNILLIDIGHYESEIPAVAQLTNYLQEKFPTFAVLQTKVDTNPVHYFTV